METLTNKTAIVTGGTRGIGRAIAERLLGDGAAVALCGRSAAGVESAVADLRPLGRVFGQAVDVTKADQVHSFFQAVDAALGPVDILVNNAGQGVFHKVAEMSLEEWHSNIDLNLNGAFYCAREALSRFLQRNGGFIVNISSLAAKNAFSGGAGYNASKFGLNGLSEAMMLDHRHDNVRVCSIMPGSVDTEFGGAGQGAGWKITPGDVSEAVSLVLRMPARTTISRLEMRPSRPPR
jgi:NAD(P)-dependent dehydrogenase (short-subunit alcohol dehydrogenase family)